MRDKEQNGSSIDTPKVVIDLRKNFTTNSKNDVASSDMIEHHSRITIDKHWEETMIHIIRC